MPTIPQTVSARPVASCPVICTRRRQLDPGRLERAVALLMDHHPELGGPVGPERRLPGRGVFVHLDLSAARAGERRRVEELVEWALGRCLGRRSSAAFVVAYLDPGAGRPGRLVLAGRRPGILGDRRCVALADALLGLYGELAATEPVPR